MKYHASHIIGAFLLPLAVKAQNTNTSSTNSYILSSGAIDLGDWADAYAKASAFVAGLTNAEKIDLVTGGDIASSNWTALQFKDGDQSVQQYEYVTGFGETSALVMTWDKELMFDQFKAVSAEFYGKGFQVTNAPTSQPLGRTPWGGRLVEALGSDSYLNGIAFGLGTKAFSETGVIPGGKHFLLNEQETNRLVMSSPSIAPYSSVADDKTLHETYLWSFYDGVKNGMGAVMCAMTKVNGTLSCENESLIQKLLKTELGFPGLVYPDVNGQATAIGSANGGLDYGSSSIWSNATLEGYLQNGTLLQARLDDMAIRNVIGYYYVNLNNGSEPSYVSAIAHVDVRANHSKIVRTNGAASLVLLKNDGVLPLSKPLSIAVFGVSAGPDLAGPNYQFSIAGTPDTYSGHLAGGAGSGQTSFPYLVTPYEALNQRTAKDGTVIRHILNNTWSESIISGLPSFVPSEVLDSLNVGTSLFRNIASYASGAEICIAFINAFSGEGGDRSELRNTEMDDMVTTVANNCNNTVVVVNTVGPRILDSWATHENVTAILYGGLLGQESGNAIVDVLYGDVNPSGRLSYTIAKDESDYNVEICTTAVCNFTEGNYIDYKYFDAYNVTPRYEFGFGLSYTTFEYSKVSATVTNSTALSSRYPTGGLAVGGKADLWDEVICVSVKITNSGSVNGNEVAQLYVAYPKSADQPIRQLRGFERIHIASGNSKTVTFSLRRRDISYWDVVAQDWAIAKGHYTFSVGASSRDLRGSAKVTI